jgi:hypothetical protein
MRKLLVALFAVLFAATTAQAQERPAYGQAELDQMLAPVALYPDSLLSQVLMASTYPLEIVEAARWSRAHPGLVGDEAVRAAADKDWDPSVKSLLAFPQLLSRMDEKLDWTRRLGEAFLAQEAQVMETVQQLRQRAQAAGHLQPDERLRVVEDGSTIVIEAADPRVVYVPYYDPYVVYGSWWWSAYPPVVWAPYYGYAVVRPGFWWGVGIGVTAGFFYGGMDWHHHHVNVAHVNSYYMRPPVARYGTAVVRPIAPGRWEHNPSHRRGVAYRAPEVQKRYAAPRPNREFRPDPRPGTGAPSRQRVERPGSYPQAQPQPGRGQTPRQEPRREVQRQDRRGQSMPPAFTTSSPPRFEARQERRTEARSEPRQPPRFEPRVQPRFEAPQRQAPRMENRGGGGGGWREQPGRGQGRG